LLNRRLLLCLTAVLVIGACSDQQEPNTESSNTSPEFASTSGTKPINVVTKTPVTAAQLAELAKYGSVQAEMRPIKAVIMSGQESDLTPSGSFPS
jgi:hypothetical protein